ncbi:MAG: hypothetical protein ACTSPL_04280 [Candidatus Odinarchaeia archaeon]
MTKEKEKRMSCLNCAYFFEEIEKCTYFNTHPHYPEFTKCSKYIKKRKEDKHIFNDVAKIKIKL